MQLTHRRRATHSHDEQTSTGQSRELALERAATSHTQLLFYFSVIVILVLGPVFYVLHISKARSPGPLSTFLLTSSIRSDDEERITLGRLSFDEDSKPSPFQEKVLACMPTVGRVGAEYVSNAVKSWRLATNGSHEMRRLIVFDVEANNLSTGQWTQKIFQMNNAMHQGSVPPLPSWLEIHQREGHVRQPRKQTLGDSLSRVNWRSKEAQDYAQVLRRCANMMSVSGEFVLIVQDDVLFTAGVQALVRWARETLREREFVDERTGRRRVQRICSGSLFDIVTDDGQQIRDGHIQQSSNMVARVWHPSFVQRVIRYIERNYDEKPVDWLVDDMCRTGRRVTLVMHPNVVRHRGAVSSFSENKREGLLT